MRLSEAAISGNRLNVQGFSVEFTYATAGKRLGAAMCYRQRYFEGYNIRHLFINSAFILSLKVLSGGVPLIAVTSLYIDFHVDVAAKVEQIRMPGRLFREVAGRAARLKGASRDCTVFFVGDGDFLGTRWER